MSESVEQAIRELTDGFPISLAFLRAADRHGLDLRFDGLHDRVVHCLAEHVLLLVDDDEEDALALLDSMNPLAVVAMVSENFISHLATSSLGCAPLWLEPTAA